MRKEASVAIRVANTACLQYAKVTTVVVSVQVRREQLARPVLSGGWRLAGDIGGSNSRPVAYRRTAQADRRAAHAV